MKDALGHGSNPGAHSKGIEDLFKEAEQRSTLADRHVTDVLAAKNQQAIYEKGDRKMVISRSLDPNYHLRATDFDSQGPVSHREYARGDKRGLQDEIFHALAGGYRRSKLR